jgi:hypothetical protein
MTCQHYWREGIVLVERGEPDPHRDGCVDCRRQHTARQQLVRAMPLVGAVPDDDSDWQPRVWQQIAREGMTSTGLPGIRRWWWSLGGALAAGCAVLVWLVVHPPNKPAGRGASDGVAYLESAETLPRIEIISGPVAKRSTSARVGDRVRISARPGDDIRVYRADHLVARCVAGAPSEDCSRGAQAIVAETALKTAGDYQLVVIKAQRVEPIGSFDADLAAVVAAGGSYDVKELSIR